MSRKRADRLLPPDRHGQHRAQPSSSPKAAWDSMQPADWRRYLIENGAKGIHEDDPISAE